MKTTVEVTVEVEIERPRDVVWEYITEPGTAHEWLDEFVSAELVSEGPPGVGSIVSYTIMPGPRTGTWEMTEWDPPHRLAWDGPPLPSMGGAGRPRGYFELVATGEHSTHLTVCYRPELSGVLVLLRPYIAWWLRKQRRIDQDKLKAILEADER